MWATGLMSAFNPDAAGGVEPSFAEMIETWIEMAWQDGSFGWIGIANLPSSFAAAAYLPDEGFAEVFTAHDNRITMGGQFAPNGQGDAVEGGYRLTGSWSFGSGTGHSEYVAAGFIPMDDGEIRWISEGLPDMQVAVLPRAEIIFTDGWHVQGLKGTGSYDYNVEDVFVPAYRTFPLFTREPHRGTSPAARMGLMPVTAAGHAVGARRRQEHARRRRGAGRHEVPDERHGVAGQPADLPERPRPPRRMWRAARLLVLDAFTTAEAAVAAGDELTPALRADMRVAAVYATDVARAVASGPTWPRAPARSARAAGSSARSVTSTPAPSTRSSARRSPSTRHRSGSASSTTSPGCDRVQETRLSYTLRLASTWSMCASAHTFTPHITCWRDRPRSVSS